LRIRTGPAFCGEPNLIDVLRGSENDSPWFKWVPQCPLRNRKGLNRQNEWEIACFAKTLVANGYLRADPDGFTVALQLTENSAAPC